MTKNLLIVNFLAFVATWVLELRGIDLTSLLGLHFFMAKDFHLYQFVTYMFLHGGFTHIFFNMFALWMFGVVIERVWGPKKFLFYYISCGIGAGIVQEIAQYANYMAEGLAAYDQRRPARYHHGDSRLPQPMDDDRCLGGRLCHPACLRYDFPQRAVVHHSLPLPHQGEVADCRLYRHRVVLST